MELPLMLRLKGTVILSIWWQVLLLILYAAGLVSLNNYLDNFEIKFPQSLIPILGIATGLLLVFRTNTASDRYHEGRKLWSTLTFNIRTLTRCFWVLVEEKEKTSREIVEKITSLNLLVAFVYATKHYLRQEYSYTEPDLRHLINHLPRLFMWNSNPYYVGDHQEEIMLAAKLAEGLVGGVAILEMRDSSSTKRTRSGKRRGCDIKAFDETTPTLIPIELTYYIASYITSVRQRALVDSSTVTVMNNALNSMVDCITGFERILRTPIPLAYTTHLHHAVWIYLLSLPWQLIGILNWFTIPAVGLAGFTILGILSIGWEIENPFGYDENDLPLDEYCNVIKKEIAKVMSHPVPPPESWLLSEDNHPLSPALNLTAADLAAMEESDIRTILSKMAHVRFSGIDLNYNCKHTCAKSVSPSGVEYVGKEGKNDDLQCMIGTP